MLRKQILITPDQSRRLKARAAATGVPESEVVRQGIELALQAEPATGEDWKARLVELMKGDPLDETFAARVGQGKNEQAKAGRRRLTRTRRLLADT